MQIPNTQGVPQFSNLAAQEVLPLVGTGVREDGQSVLNAIDADLARLYEDRNILLTGGGDITNTGGTSLAFTADFVLYINSNIAGAAPYTVTITTASSPFTFGTDGDMAYITIADRTTGAFTLTTDAATLPAVASSAKEVFLIAKRVGTDIVFVDGSLIKSGESRALGGAGAGISGIGSTITGATAGSVLFAGASGVLTQDNANFFWDDTNNLLGIGTNAPNTVGSVGRKNLVIASSTNAGLTIKAGAGYVASINFTDTDGANQGLITYDTISDEMAFFTGVTPAQAMRIDSSGNVGIGTSSPENKLHLEGAEQLASATQLTVEGRYAGYGAGINFVSRTSLGGTRVSMAKITADGENAWDTTPANQDAGLRFFTTLDGSLTEKMRINSSGNVGIGTNTPLSALTISANGILGGGEQLNITGSNTDKRLRLGFDTTADIGTISALVSGVGFKPIAINPDGGNVGIGTNTPDTVGVTARKNLVLNSASNVGMTLKCGTGQVASIAFTDVDATTQGLIAYETASDFMAFYTGATTTEKMRIDSNGTVLIGTTTAPSSGGDVGLSLNTGGTPLIRSAHSGTASEAHVQFFNGNGVVGAISTSGSSTTYATSSDYRLKENVQPMTNALAKVSQLKPCTYTWKVDGTPGQGFIAHELQEVIPDAVTGEKDAVDAQGKPIHQGIDQSKVVATLAAAIKELKADLDATKEQLAALQQEFDDYVIAHP